MSRLMKVMAAMADFNVVGYSAYKGVNILFTVESNDEKLKNKIRTNTLSGAERNFIVSTVRDYFVDTVRTDETLFNYGVANIVIDAMESKMDLPKNIINQEFLQKIMQKKQGTGQKVFNKNKFKGLPLDQKSQIITDYDEFFDYVWGGDFVSNRSFDILNLIQLQGEEEDIGDEDEDVMGSLKKKQVKASISKYNPAKKYQLLKPIKIYDEQTGQVTFNLKKDDILNVVGYNHETYSEVFEFNGQRFEFSDYNIINDPNSWSPGDMLVKDLEKDSNDNNISTGSLNKKVATTTPITKNSKGIKVDGYEGTWSVIDSNSHNGESCYLLENDKYGEDTGGIWISRSGRVLLDDVYNGLLDLIEWEKQVWNINRK